MSFENMPVSSMSGTQNWPDVKVCHDWTGKENLAALIPTMSWLMIVFYSERGCDERDCMQELEAKKTQCSNENVYFDRQAISNGFWTAAAGVVNCDKQTEFCGKYLRLPLHGNIV